MDPIAAILVKMGPAVLGWALFAVCAFGVLRGHLIISTQVASMREDADKRVAQSDREAERWHTAFMERAATVDQLVRQNGQLMEGAEIAKTVTATVADIVGEAGS